MWKKEFLTMLLIFLTTVFASAQTVTKTEFATGEIIEKVEIPNSGKQSFALYLPNNYNVLQKFPVLFCFDPLARGKTAVEHFRVAAEQYGYLVIASNNSQNAMDGTTLSKIILALWNDAHKRFSIDEKRVYVAGFSGGARVAAGFAAYCKGCVFGVIGSGGGFPTGLRVSSQIPFVYFGAVGFDDYNYTEMRNLAKELEKSQRLYRIETFDGRHQWLDETRAKEALAWFEILAMRDGRREKDEKFIEDFFRLQTAQAETFLSEKNYLEAFQTLRRIVSDFSLWRDVSKYESSLKTLQYSAELKNAIEEEDRQFRRQREIVAEIVKLGTTLLYSEERDETLRQIRQIVRVLQKKSEEKTDSAERRIARRSLNHVFAETVEAAVFFFEREGKMETPGVNLSASRASLV